MRYDGETFAGFPIIVKASGPAAAAGFEEGDEIIGVDGELINAGDLITDCLPQRDTFTLLVRRAAAFTGV